MADTTRKKRASTPSVASHPLFPVVVVLWFGALFGLASLAIRPTLIEGLVSATGIDMIVPMAAPPLGFTTRVLIALLMTGLGCAVGAIVARSTAKPAPVIASARRRRPAMAEQAEATPSPVALFGAERIDQDEAEQPARRRRQLAIMDAEESFDDNAPLPGKTQILSVAELPLKSFDEVDEIWLHSSDRIKPRTDDVVIMAEDIESMEPDADQEEAIAPVAPTMVPDASDYTPTTEAGVDHEGDDRSNRLFESYVRRVNVGVGSNDSDTPAPGFDTVPVVPGYPVDTPDVKHERAENSAPAGDGQAADHVDATQPPIDTAYASTAYANAAERIATAPLDALSHVELLERLAQTIARRRREAVERPSVAQTVPSPAEPVWFSAPQSVAASGEMPAALRPRWMDAADEDENDALPAIVPARGMTMGTDFAPRTLNGSTAQAHDATREDGSVATSTPNSAAPQDDPEVLAQGYSSLLGVTRAGARQVFGRADVPDAATISPAPAPRAFDAPHATDPAPDQTEQALRAALATLRRMSGAA